MSEQRVSDELARRDAAGRKRPVECVPPGPVLPGLRAYAKDLLDSRAEAEQFSAELRAARKTLGLEDVPWITPAIERLVARLALVEPVVEAAERWYDVDKSYTGLSLQSELFVAVRALRAAAQPDEEGR